MREMRPARSSWFLWPARNSTGDSPVVLDLLPIADEDGCAVVIVPIASILDPATFLSDAVSLLFRLLLLSMFNAGVFSLEQTVTEQRS